MSKFKKNQIYLQGFVYLSCATRTVVLRDCWFLFLCAHEKLLSLTENNQHAGSATAVKPRHVVRKSYGLPAQRPRRFAWASPSGLSDNKAICKM
ncbi:hypothetical protein, partial [Flavobacterium cyanobacteriorum]|uniref:hypothetical protein n=1 Tax=Flavobacterium cyanobacteriorum TaxID=2022802 RepID=UPI001A9C50F5